VSDCAGTAEEHRLGATHGLGWAGEHGDVFRRALNLVRGDVFTSSEPGA